MSFCFTFRPPPSSATVRSATRAKLREARAELAGRSAQGRRTAPALRPKRPSVTLWKKAPERFEIEKATWPQNASVEGGEALRGVGILAPTWISL